MTLTMEWLEHMNDAVEYLEENLCEKIDVEAAAKLACCSSFHFQRMFSYMAGVPLGEYLRRRRMSAAAVDLQNGAAVLAVSLRYGYESPTAFNRAFQSVHGVVPSAVRQEGIMLKACPRISFKLIVQGAVEMEYKIITKQEFRIVGVKAPLKQEIEQNFQEVPKLWQKAAMSGWIELIAQRMDGELKGILGVSACMPGDEWNYYIAVNSTLPLPENLPGACEYTVPASTWAVFPGEGAGVSIQELEKRIVTEWLPTSGYEYANAPDVEVYLNADPAHAQYEVWIPVVPAKK